MIHRTSTTTRLAPRPRRLLAVLAVLGLILASCASDGSTRETADDLEQLEGLTRCFAFSIDQVGRGNLPAGIEGFDECLADDYVFEFAFFEGGPSVVCPGEQCAIQEFDSPAELRARFAGDFFGPAGYMATQHQILNVDVTQDGDTAEIFAYIQANHFKADNSVDISWNDYSFQAQRDGDRWVVTNELITGTAFLNFQGTPVG